MTIKESDILEVRQPQLTFWEKIYLPTIIEGLLITFRHIFRRKKTMQYPEQRRERIPVVAGGMRGKNFRGVHRLNKDDEGRVACVACFMCSTACPAECIHIVGGEAPWPDREKFPVSFEIDELRCIYCGMCEEACPVDAIELTPMYSITGKSREEMIYDKEKLLSIFDETKDVKPRRNPQIVGYSCGHKPEAVSYWGKVEKERHQL